MNVEAFLERFQGVRRSGSGWQALCPAHGDKNPSLSISEGDGKILLHCHAGCLVEAICAAAGIETRDLFTDNGPVRRIVAVYDYTNERGVLLYQVVRFEPKSFRQRRPDGRGGWIWNLDGTRPVPYRLPEVFAAAFVLVCEGEKDCETARALGLVATCNPGGAGKWRVEYGEALRGRRVAIIADADEPGRRHALAIAESLFGKATSIRVAELPGSKDLSDWIAAGGNREALAGWLDACAPEWQPGLGIYGANGAALAVASDSRSVRIAQWGDVPLVENLPEQRVEWLAEGLIPRASLVLLAGQPGAMKTWLALVLARSVAAGNLFLGRECQQSDVLYLDRENPAAVMRERCELLDMVGLENIRLWGGWLEDPPPAIGDFRLAQIARERKPLAIFDSLIRFSSAADENSASDVAPTMGELRALANAGATVLLLHHRAKSEASRYRGSSDILAGVDMAYSVWKDAASGLLQVECFKSRFGEESKLTLRPNLEGAGDFEVTDSPAAAREHEQIEQLRRFIEENPGLAKREVARRAGIPQHRALLLLGQEAGRFWRIERGEHNSQRLYPLAAEMKAEILP